MFLQYFFWNWMKDWEVNLLKHVLWYDILRQYVCVSLLHFFWVVNLVEKLLREIYILFILSLEGSRKYERSPIPSFKIPADELLCGFLVRKFNNQIHFA